jgi:hypothetical protein
MTKIHKRGRYSAALKEKVSLYNMCNLNLIYKYKGFDTVGERYYELYLKELDVCSGEIPKLK